MKRLGRRQGTGLDVPEINLAPLMDMVFILLIFFVVTTVFVEETGLSVKKPKAVSAQTLEKNSILIAITANGEVVYGERVTGKYEQFDRYTEWRFGLVFR